MTRSVTLTANKISTPTLPSNLLKASPEKLKRLLAAFPEEISITTVQTWTDTLDVKELAKRLDLDSFIAIFQQVEKQFRTTRASSKSLQEAQGKIDDALKIRFQNTEELFKIFKQAATANQEPKIADAPIKALLEAGVNWETEKNIGTQKKNLLELACSRGWQTVIKALVDNGCDINQTNSLGNNALFLINVLKNADIFNMLIQMGANVKHVNADDCTLLHRVAQFSDLEEVIEKLVALGVDTAHANKSGQTAVHLAVFYDNAKSLKKLAQSGAPLTSKDLEGCTPLHRAGMNRSLLCMRTLVDCGVDINEVDDNGFTMLHNSFLRRAPFTNTQIYSFNPLKSMIDAGADINHKNGNGQTLLDIAVSDNFRDLRLDNQEYWIEELCKAGAYLNARDTEGKTVLHLSVAKPRHLNIFLRFEVDVTIRDNSGKTALQEAVHQKSIYAIKSLLNAKNTNIEEAISTDTDFLKKLTRNILQDRPTGNIVKLLQLCVCNKFQTQWEPNSELFLNRPVEDQHFLFREDLIQPSNFQVRVGHDIGSIQKSAFYSIIQNWDLSADQIAQKIRDIVFPPPRQIRAYKLKLHRDELKLHPEKILHTLNELFTKNISNKLTITFSGDRGVDEGGLSRQFIHTLLSELCLKMNFQKCDNALFRPVMQKGDMNEKLTYRALGALILFCLNSHHYPTGPLLDQGVFAALCHISIEKSFEDQSFDELFALLQKLYSSSESDIKMTEHLRAQSTPEEIYDQFFLSKLYPIYEIAVGMKHARFQSPLDFAAVQAMTPSKFSEKLQGKFSKDAILAKLQFDNTISAESRLLVRNWICEADEKKLKLFLFAISGSNAVGEDVKIFFDKGSSIAFHTCGFQVTLDFDAIKNTNDLAERMDVALTSIEIDPKFDFF